MLAKTQKNIFYCLIIVALFFSGCGYTAGSLLPAYLRTIYVDSFQNKIDVSAEPSDKERYKIYRPGIENDITRAVIDRFIFDGHLRIVGKNDANLILTGELVDYYKQPLRYDRQENIEEYRIIVVVNLELKDLVKNRLTWKETNFVGYHTYRLTGPFATNEDSARAEAVKDLAQKVVEKVIEGW